ncbi:MAG: hypothetical protein IAC23_10575 [Bacteroidetes bacterium]|uniref:Uncharacterized protein n=1 Tax=Candidatus Cryptobacteroides merdavium TaxID=2840769 RepID=A0A9D9HDV9_9BACT|nr:hypothetical protein [Candidatus Cryptobacteroides merdavium]
MTGNRETASAKGQTGNSASGKDDGIFRRSLALAEEIAAFLERHGILCKITFPEGFPLIVSGKWKAVMPLGICAGCQERASEIREMAENAISEQFRKDKETSSGSTRPIILAEDRWRGVKGECIRQRLLAHFGIFRHVFARNCEARRIHRDMAREFLDVYHSYGHTVCRYSYGLFLKKAVESDRIPTGNEVQAKSAPGQSRLLTGNGIPAGTLVAVATFSNGRLMPRNGKVYRSYQWIRYASLPDVRVSGGMGKMLKHFISDMGMGREGRHDGKEPENFGGCDIMSYADLEWSGGDVYRQLGFIAEDRKSPVMYSISPSGGWERTPVSRMKLQENTESIAVTETPVHPQSGNLYFENFGSTRYRLVIPEQKRP